MKPSRYYIVLIFLLFLFPIRIVAQMKPIVVNYDITVGGGVNLGSSPDLYFEPNGYDQSWGVSLLTNIPINEHYFVTIGAGIEFTNTSVLYNSDSVSAGYFNKSLDTRGMEWDFDVGYFHFPMLINMQTAPIQSRTSALIGAGLVHKKKFESHFNIYNDYISEYQDITMVRDYNLSFLIRFGIKRDIDRKSVFLAHVYYERSLLPIQKFETPEVYYETVGVKIGWNFKFDDY